MIAITQGDDACLRFALTACAAPHLDLSHATGVAVIGHSIDRLQRAILPEVPDTPVATTNAFQVQSYPLRIDDTNKVAWLDLNAATTAALRPGIVDVAIKVMTADGKTTTTHHACILVHRAGKGAPS